MSHRACSKRCLRFTQNRRGRQLWGSATAAAPALASTRWLRVGTGVLIQSGNWRWGQQCCGLDGKTTRPPCGIEGNHHQANRLCTAHRQGQNGGGCRDEGCDQKSHCGIFADLEASGRNPCCAIRAPSRSWSLVSFWRKTRRGRSEQRNCERLGFAQRDSFSPCI